MGNGGSSTSAHGSPTSSRTVVLEEDLTPFPGPAWVLIIASFEIKHVAKIGLASKALNCGIWGYCSSLDFFRNRVKATPLNRILKRLVKGGVHTNLTSLQLFSGAKPIWFEKSLFKSLGKFTGLKTLAFGNKRGGIEYLQDGALAGLSALAVNLTSLDMSYCYGITEAGYSNLSLLTGLRNLAMRNCLFADEAFKYVNTPNLERLDLHAALGITVPVASAIAKLTNLTELDLSNTEIMGKPWLALDMSGMTRLRHLNIENNVWLGDSTVAQIATLTSLEHLHMRYCGRFPAVPLVLSETGMLAITALTNLRLLSLEGTVGVSNQLLQGLTNMTNLQMLNIRKCPRLTNPGFESLSSLTSLLMLHISHARISIAARSLTALTGLKGLQLVCCEDLRPEDLRGFSKLRNLLWLDLIDCPNIGENIGEMLSNVAYLRRTAH